MEEKTSNKWKIGLKHGIENCTGTEWREQLWSWKCEYSGLHANFNYFYLALKTEGEARDKWKIGLKQVIETCTGTDWKE